MSLNSCASESDSIGFQTHFWNTFPTPSRCLPVRAQRISFKMELRKMSLAKKPTTRDKINFHEGACTFGPPSMLFFHAPRDEKNTFPRLLPQINFEEAFLRIGKIGKLILSRVGCPHCLFPDDDDGRRRRTTTTTDDGRRRRRRRTTTTTNDDDRRRRRQPRRGRTSTLRICKTAPCEK